MKRPTPRRRSLALLCCLFACAACLTVPAFEVSPFKRVSDRMGAKVVETYDIKARAFGSGAQQTDAGLQALCVAALCSSPREYRETNGPFISEPVAVLVEKIKSGALKDASPETFGWIAYALKTTDNEAHKPLMREMAAKMAPHGAPADAVAEYQKILGFATLAPADQAKLLTNLHMLLKDSPKTEVARADGSKTSGAQLVAETFNVLENKTGKISEDLRINALGLLVATGAYKALK